MATATIIGTTIIATTTTIATGIATKKNFGIASTGRSVSLRNLADLKQRVCRLAVQIPVSVLHVAIRKNHEIIRVDCPRNAVNSAADLLFHKAVLFAGVKINAFSIRLD